MFMFRREGFGVAVQEREREEDGQKVGEETKGDFHDWSFGHCKQRARKTTT